MERFGEIDACYVCVHVWCTMQGSPALRDALRAQLARDECAVEVREYTCFGVCHKAPNLMVSPEGTWYTQVTPDDLPDIVAHLQGAAPAPHFADRFTPRLHALVREAFEERRDAGLTMRLPRG